jgi:HlyD family secretion protein
MRRVWIIAAVLIAIAGGSALLYFYLQPKPAPAQLVYGSGRIEADEVRIAPQVAGRLLETAAREGNILQAGQVVARIDSSDLELSASQAEAQRRATLYSTGQIDAQIRLAEHHAMIAQGDLARFETLRRQGWTTISQLDVRRNAYATASDQASALRQQRAQTIAQTEVASHSLALARQQLGKTLIRAPLTGAVLERLAEPGEVLAAGQPVAILADLRKVRLRIFVSEAELGKIRLGSPARIRVDAFRDREFAARVARVDAQAQFTPRDVHMRDERVRTVYGVQLEADNATGLLKPGMPADAWILWDRVAGWPSRLVVPE